MIAYYNEIDPFAAQWLRNLISAGHLPAGDVDERSIVDVRPDDLAGYTQCHFFAGIGGWPLAFRLAGWPDDKAVWSGSCPCQPLSSAGQRKGHADERHLWPAFFSLIAERRPARVFGEQVASKDGREWLSGVRADLETLGYACGAADLCAAGVGAPHIRPRLYWVADSVCAEWRPAPEGRLNDIERANPGREKTPSGLRLCGSSGRLGFPDCNGRPQGNIAASALGYGGSAHTTGRPDPSGMGDTDSNYGHWWSGPVQVGWNGVEAEIERGGWKYRAQWRIKPGLPLLADGIPNRVGRLRGYGNAIVPQVGAEFIGSFLDVVMECAP